MNRYQTVIVKKADTKLIEEWNELWEKGENATIFNSYQWFLTCLQTYTITEYELHVCYRDGNLVAILPLYKYKSYGINVSGSICNNFLVDTAFLVEKYDTELLRHFFATVSNKRNIFIQKVDKTAAKLLHDIFPDMLFSVMSVNPSVDFSLDPIDSISKSTVQQIKKVRKKNPGQLKFTLYDSDLQKHLRTMFTVEQNSSKKLNSMDIFSKQKNKDFYSNLVKNCNHLTRIGFLYYDNIPVAYQFGFIYKDVFVAYQTSYLYEYAKLRPGKTMLFYLIESLKETGIKTLDLGGGISTYKQEFTPNYRLLYNVYYSKNKFVMRWWKLINLAGRTKKTLFPEKNTKDHEFIFKTI